MIRIMEVDERKRDAESHALVWNAIFGVVDSLVLKCSVKLNIVDTIHRHGQPITLSEIGASLPVPCTDISKLSRFMRYLAHIRIVNTYPDTYSNAEESYTLAPASKFLLKEEDSSLASYVKLFLDEDNILSILHNLEYNFIGSPTVSTYEKVKGEGFWDRMSRDPEFNRTFNEGMVGRGRRAIAGTMEACPELFMGIRTLVDVGGGVGMVGKDIVRKFPHLHCTVLDLPRVVEGSPEAPGIEYIAGDMFKVIPHADAVLLMAILHSYDDDKCLQILKQCKEAIPKNGGKLIIVDPVLEEKTEEQGELLSHARMTMDILMMCFPGGKERTEREWKELLFRAGFSEYKIFALDMSLEHAIVVDS